LAESLTATEKFCKLSRENYIDPSLANKALEVAGDTLTAKQLKATYEEATGTKLTEKLLGSVSEFKAWIAAKKAAASQLEEYIYHQYIYAMVSGKGKLERIENDYLRLATPTLSPD
jgi:hypothetical protein